MNRTIDAFKPTASTSTVSTAARELPDNGFAFLNHSQASLGRQSPPDVDNQRLARQKRRRTSPEDQAILEAEFVRDSKPDKAARLDIVKRVALGEKEVQIWFQNRRQLSRRKSRPSDAQEAEESIEMSQSNTTRDSTQNSSFSATEVSLVSSQSSAPCSQENLIDGQPAASQERASDRFDKDSRVFDLSVDGRGRSKGICQTFKMDSAGTMRPRQPADTFNIMAHKKRPGYLANRRSASFIIHEDREGGSTQTSFSSSQDTSNIADERSPEKPLRMLRRASSMIKLSMDADGKAEVTPRTGDTPSPPKSASFLDRDIGSRRLLGLQRSLSAIDTSASRLGRSSTSLSQSVGRSRDARTWEFYCDSSARDELIKQAERVESGSAAAAIGLLRAQSKSLKPLTPNLNRGNTQVLKRGSLKRSKTDLGALKRAKLERTTSSVARLQSTGEVQAKPIPKKQPSKHRKSNPQSAIFEDFEGDSDKENWQPGTQRRAEPRPRPVQSQSSSRILLESVGEPSQTSSVSDVRERRGARHRLPSTQTYDKENAGPHIDDEVAHFMEGPNSLAREEEDLNCVQNLLSLSQGPWA